MEYTRALDDAWDAGCLICKGSADNRGRRVASAIVGHDAVFPVGSTNRQGAAADICPSADYVLAATPGGERSSDDDVDFIWSTGGNRDYVSFAGGCMASGFAGGVAALVRSRFSGIGIETLKMVLANTSSGNGWNPLTGYGVLDARAAVSLDDDDLRQLPRIDVETATLDRSTGSPSLTVQVKNDGVIDIERALLVVFDGDPTRPADPTASRESPATLVTRQRGHAIVPIRGLHSTSCTVAVEGDTPDELFLQLSSLDHHGAYEVDTVRVR